MHLPSVIHRRHFQQDVAVHEIKRRARLSRNTTPKRLRADAVESVLMVLHRLSKLDLSI